MTIKLGIVDCDTSHVVAFTQRLHHVDVAEDHWVDGAKVVAAVPLPTLITPERVGPFVEKLRGYGIEILEKPEQLIGKIDAVLVESNDGQVHRERAMPFIEAGIPTWIDKPFACSTKDAIALVEAAQKRNVPLLSASSLRFDVTVQDVKNRREELGAVHGVDAFSPASQHERNPGFFHYGVHAVEIMYSLMGVGCRRVRCVRTEGTDVAVGEWQDGRIGTVRGIRSGSKQTGFTAVTEKQVITTRASGYGYRELLKQLVKMFETKQSPLSGQELIEPVAFQEAALVSMDRGGAPVDLKEVGLPG